MPQATTGQMVIWLDPPRHAAVQCGALGDVSTSRRERSMTRGSRPQTRSRSRVAMALAGVLLLTGAAEAGNSRYGPTGLGSNLHRRFVKQRTVALASRGRPAPRHVGVWIAGGAPAAYRSDTPARHVAPTSHVVLRPAQSPHGSTDRSSQVNSGRTVMGQPVTQPVTFATVASSDPVVYHPTTQPLSPQVVVSQEPGRFVSHPVAARPGGTEQVIMERVVSRPVFSSMPPAVVSPQFPGVPFPGVPSRPAF